MWLNELYKRLMGRTSRQRTFIRPCLERLEDRPLLSAPVNDIAGLLTAINTANTAGGSTTITLASGTTFDFTTANNSTNGNNALPVITANITIVGNGDLIVRTGSNAFRLFDVASGGSLNLQNVRLDGGLAFGYGAAAEGGAIYSSGKLNLSGVTVQSNEANGFSGGDASGGGVFMSKGSLTLTNDSFIANRAVGGGGSAGFDGQNGNGDGGNGGGGNAFGGALYLGGNVSVTGGSNSFSVNYAQGGNGGGGHGAYGILTNGGNGGAGGSGGAGGNATGGGLYMAAGSATLTNDALSGNYAQGGNSGGGGGAGGNAAGGGLYTPTNNGAVVVLINDTLSSNVAQGGNGAGGGYVGTGAGGGLFILIPDSTRLFNTLIAENTTAAGTVGAASAASASGPDVSGTVESSDYDLIGNSSGFSTHVSAGDILDPTSVGLDPNGLRNNGGPLVGAPGSQRVLQTIALEPGSVAIDAGSSVYTELPSTDERGYARTVGNAADIGAIEYQYNLSINGSAPSSVQAGQIITYNLTVTNNGPDTAGNGGVTLTDVLPGGVTYQSSTAPSGWLRMRLSQMPREHAASAME